MTDIKNHKAYIDLVTLLVVWKLICMVVKFASEIMCTLNTTRLLRVSG